MPESQARRLIPVSAIASTVTQPIGRWAILIGISQYEYSHLNLRYADRDVEALQQLLLGPVGGSFPPDQICTLTNAQATTAAITRALRSFLKKPARDDLVIIYFACHGSPDPDRPENLYLITHDTNPRDIAGTALPMREIDLSIRENLLAEKIIILADTCHSAGIANTIGRRSINDSTHQINRYLKEISQAKDGIALLTSAEANETSFEDAKWGGGHGVFTYYLLAGMNGAADQNQNGSVNLGELFEYVRENVQRDTDHRQHPLIGANPFDRNLTIAIPNALTDVPPPAVATLPPVTAPTRSTAALSEPPPTISVPATDRLIFDLGSDGTIALLPIPGGSFSMGSAATDRDHIASEAPQHTVTLNPFYLSATPITQAQWRIVAAMPRIEHELNPQPSRFSGDMLPVEQVSWFEAIEFCQRLAQFLTRSIRLPSEAEWEYACRANTSTAFSFGDSLTPSQANYDWRKAETDQPPSWLRQTTPVQQFPANSWGLYDLHGNVAEWCQDGWHPNYKSAPNDGSAWAAQDDSGRIIRGGSWFSPPKQCRSAYRSSRFPGLRDATIGFRIALSNA
jgi:formylglycine-generating enzyme required for sulfatase activity